MLLLFLQAAVAQPPLNLTCVGGGTANKAAVATVNSYGNASGMVGTTPFNASGNGTSTVTTMRHQGFEDQVDLRLFAGDDRIRMPRTMLPPLHGGADGWFKLKDVRVDDRSIKASAAVNFMNNPKVYVDRVTGTITISGRAGDFTGQCESMDPQAPKKF
jgi:hypothetical protein